MTGRYEPAYDSEEVYAARLRRDCREQERQEREMGWLIEDEENGAAEESAAWDRGDEGVFLGG